MKPIRTENERDLLEAVRAFLRHFGDFDFGDDAMEIHRLKSLLRKADAEDGEDR